MKLFQKWRRAEGGTGGRGGVPWRPWDDPQWHWTHGGPGFPPGTFKFPATEITDEEAAEIRQRLRESLSRFSQGVRPPAFAPRHTYGGKGTIHKTGTVDIEQDENGNVVAVWFRCLSLPFKVFAGSSSTINPQGIAIEEITYVDLPSEESSQ